MRYKAKVLKSFPSAVLVTIDRWDDGSPRYQRVVVPPAGPADYELILDVHNDDVQYAVRAWRSAYHWILRAKQVGMTSRRMETE